MKHRIATIRLESGPHGVCIQVPSEEFPDLSNVKETIAKCPHGTDGRIPADARRLAACWNACHGLDLPDDIPAGAVAALVAAAREMFDAPLDGGMDTSDKIADFRAALAPFTAAPVSTDYPDDRRPVGSFEVDGKHVRWCGTLDQWHKDRLAYVDKSEGTWEAHGPHMWRFIEPPVNGAKPIKTIFRAVKQK